MKDTIEFCQKQGLSFIPVPFKEKAATILWAEFQKRKPTDAEVQKWFLNGHQTNLAIVCGSISDNLVVLDCDTDDKFWELAPLICEKTGCKDILDYTTVVKTGKGWHIYLKTEKPVKSMKFPNLDIKAEGGYVIAPPSIHPSGAGYKFANETYTPPIRRIGSLKDIGIDFEQIQPGIKPTFTNDGEKIPKGQHDNWLHKRASTYRGQGDTEEIIFEKLKLDLNRLADVDTANPYTEKDLQRIARSTLKYPVNPLPVSNPIYSNTYVNSIYIERDSKSDTNGTPNGTPNGTQLCKVSLSEKIDVWVTETKGRWFDTSELDRDLGVQNQTDKENRRKHLLRLEERKIIERHAKQNKSWRFVNKELIELDYKTLSTAKPLQITLPLGLSHLVNLFPGNLAVFAGATNSGKTAAALEVIRLNNNGTMPIYYFYSEGGGDELRNRLDGCEGMDISEWKMRAFSRSVDFADVIAPDCLNVVDYLEITDDFYSVADKLTAMCERIGNGLVIVCLQKNANAKFGRGGSFSAEKSRLYLAFDEAEGARKCKCRIVKGKSWAQKGYNPNGLETVFSIENGWIDNNEEGTWEYKKEDN
jgi:hypothetical protein